MTINLRRILAGVVCFMVLGASVSRVMAQQPSAARAQTPAVIKYDGDMASLLATLTEIYGVTIGLEVDPKQPKSRVSLFLREPTLADVLNAVVKSAPGYKWRESGGCLEVLPVEGSTPLLDTTINNFWVSGVDQAEATNQLMNLPEVQDSMRALNLNRQNLAGASAGTKNERFSMNLEGVTVRQALSKIASESGGRFWIFRASGDGLFSLGNSVR